MEMLGAMQVSIENCGIDFLGNSVGKAIDEKKCARKTCIHSRLAMIFWKSEPKIFPQMVGLDVDESHGIPIRKKSPKKNTNPSGMKGF